MNKFVTLPSAALLALVVVACGKADSSSPVVSGPAPVEAPPTNPPVNPPANGDLYHWCWNQGGQYYASENICKLQLQYQQVWNVVGSLNTGIPVYPKDTISVTATKSPEVNVGGQSYGITGSFVASNSGPIVLRGRGQWDVYRVKSIKITRCYAHDWSFAICPN